MRLEGVNKQRKIDGVERPKWKERVRSVPKDYTKASKDVTLSKYFAWKGKRGSCLPEI